MNDQLRVSAVLPLALRDDAEDELRMRLLLDTLNARCSPGLFHEIVLVCADNALAFAESLIDDTLHPLRVVPERDWLLPVGKHTSGWHKQQILKLRAAEKLECHAYLTLDSDLLVIHELARAQLIDEQGRCSAPLQPRIHEQWWQASAKILGVELRDQSAIGVTPQLLKTSWVRNLLRKLHQWKGDRWAIEACRRGTWTEYTLYWLSLTEQARAQCPNKRLCDNAVWDRSKWAGWMPTAGDRRIPFSLVNSNLGIPAALVAKRLDAFGLLTTSDNGLRTHLPTKVVVALVGGSDPDYVNTFLPLWVEIYNRSQSTLPPVLLTDGEVPECWPWESVKPKYAIPESLSGIRKQGDWLKCQAYQCVGRCLVADPDYYPLRPLDEVAATTQRLVMQSPRGPTRNMCNSGLMLIDTPDFFPHIATETQRRGTCSLEKVATDWYHAQGYEALGRQWNTFSCYVHGRVPAFVKAVHFADWTQKKNVRARLLHWNVL